MLVAVLLIATAWAATTWTAASTLEVRSSSPPAFIAKGSAADEPRYFRSFDLSTNQTAFSAEVKPRAGADMYVADVFEVTNAASTTLSITLRATQVTNPRVEAFEWTVRNGTTPVATLDHLAASPAASFSLAAGQTFEVDIRIDLADGAGKANAGISFDLWLEVTP